VSNAGGIAPMFFDLYSCGAVSADRINDFISAWHASDDEERRSLAAYLGLTDAEYEVWLMDTDVLPQILSARRTGRGLREVVADYVAALQRAARPEDRSSLYLPVGALAWVTVQSLTAGRPAQR
jgi:hypothetical protein